mgnify:CR=1 FL=1
MRTPQPVRELRRLLRHAPRAGRAILRAIRRDGRPTRLVLRVRRRRDRRLDRFAGGGVDALRGGCEVRIEGPVAVTAAVVAVAAACIGADTASATVYSGGRVDAL